MSRELVGKITSDEINALPEHVRRYVRDLETICDPAGMVQEIAALRDQVRALTLRLNAGIEKRENIARDVQRLRDEVVCREVNRQRAAFFRGEKYPY